MAAASFGGVDGVLFDAAGTLIELREPVGATYARFAAAYGAEVPASRLQEAFERVFRGAPPNAHPALPEADRPAAERSWWRDRVRETFRAADQMARLADFEAFFDDLFTHYGTAAAWRLCSGASAALIELRREGIRTAVLSNFDHRLPPLLHELGTGNAFEFVLTPTQTGTAKPAQAFFEAALSRLALPAARVVYVGDDPTDDHQGAAGAGIESIDVRELESLAELLPRLARTAARRS